MRGGTWYECHGSWWMLQWCLDWWFSLGIHFDVRRRFASIARQHYGPYVDIHIGCLIISLGYHPYYSSEWERVISAGRGGEIA